MNGKTGSAGWATGPPRGCDLPVEANRCPAPKGIKERDTPPPAAVGLHPAAVLRWRHGYRDCDARECTRPKGLQDCSSICVDVQSDLNKCGKCASECGVEETCVECNDSCVLVRRFRMCQALGEGVELDGVGGVVVVVAVAVAGLLVGRHMAVRRVDVALHDALGQADQDRSEDRAACAIRDVSDGGGGSAVRVVRSDLGADWAVWCTATAAATRMSIAIGQIT